ncbi:MAG: metallophosphoesterase [Rhodocyclaceae bacterium]|nr:metallophosphoesterase [Rhodocyclaceae bacterium]
MRRLLHLSDPHFGTERPRVVEALVATVASIGFDVAVISGDLTQRALPGQFRRAARFVARLQALAPGAPVLINPGNHDVPLFNPLRRVSDPFGPFCEAFGLAPESSYRDEALHLQVINTTSRWRHKHGLVRPDQVTRTVRALRDSTASQLRVLVTHQPLAASPGQDSADLLRGRGPAVQAWRDAGVDLVLGGHIHLPYVVNACAAGGRPLWVVQAGTMVSHRIRHEAGNSFNLIRYEPDPAGRRAPACRVERWDHVDDLGAFRRVMTTPLALARAPAQAAADDDASRLPAESPKKQ